MYPTFLPSIVRPWIVALAVGLALGCAAPTGGSNDLAYGPSDDPGAFPDLGTMGQDDLATHADGLVWESAGVLVLSGGGGATATATATTATATGTGLGVGACLASVICGVVVAAVVIGGVTLIAIHVDNRADAERARELTGAVNIDGGRTLAAVLGYQAAFDSRWEAIEGDTGFIRAITSAEQFVAVTYSWQCQNYGGGDACVGRARDWVNCTTHGGGNACHRLVGGLEQYQSAHAAVTSEDDRASDTDAATDDCPGVAQGLGDTNPSINTASAEDAARGMDRSRFRLGQTKANIALICPEDLVGPWLEALARAMADRGRTLRVNRFRFGPHSSPFADYVNRLQDAADGVGDCGPSDFPINVVEPEDPESAERISNQRDATDHIDGFSMYAMDEAAHRALIRHGNLSSTITSTYYCQ